MAWRFGGVMVVACSSPTPVETLHSTWTPNAASPELAAIQPRPVQLEEPTPMQPPPLWAELEVQHYVCRKPSIRTSSTTLLVSVSTPSTYLASVARCELLALGMITIMPAPVHLDVAVELASAVREPSGDVACKATLTFSAHGQAQGTLSSAASVINSNHADQTLLIADCVEATIGDAIANRLAPWFGQQTSGWVAWPSASARP